MQNSSQNIKSNEIYQKILEYYDYAEQLIDKMEEFQGTKDDSDLLLIEQMILELENCGDHLSELYIELVKSDNSADITNKINAELDIISARVHFFQAKFANSQIAEGETSNQ
jgi:hypothetical protein